MSDPMEANEEELQSLLGQAIARRPWPPVGTVVTIGYDWDGKETYQNDAYLTLKAGDKVRVEEISAQGGILFGSVIGGRNQAKGWFGGSGCEATLQVSISVLLGADTGEVPPEKEGAGNGDFGDYRDAASKDVDAGDVFIAVEEYLARHQVDETASDKLRDLEPEVQAEIIKSDITNSRNPSAVLLSRIERVLKGGTSAPVPKGGKSKGDAKGKGSPKGATVRAAPRARSRSPRRPADRWDDRGKGGGKDHRDYDRISGSEDVEDFIYKLNLDGKCADELRALPYPDQMHIVKVDLTNARNPSAVVYSRIQSMKGSESLRRAVDDYLYRNKIDEVAAKALEALPKDKQELIISTDLSNSRNPSAVLLSRIRQIEAGQMPNSAGKFAPAGGAGPPPRSYSAPPEDRGRRPDRREIEDYVRKHNLDDRMADEMRSLSPSELNQVLSSNITNARNPNAVVKTRIEAARQRSGLKNQVEDYVDKYSLDEVAARQLRDLAPDMQQRIVEQELSNCRNPSAVLLSRIRGMQKGTR